MKENGPTIKCWPSGRKLNLLHPTPEQIHIEDIAHHLSLLPRYLGGTEKPYNNAQHSWFISYVSPGYLKLPALLHDAAEAYTGDLPGQFKRLPGMELYRDVQYGITNMLMAKFGIDWDLEMAAEVKKIETKFFPWEEFIVGRDIMPDWENHPTMDEVWSQKISEQKFLKAFHQLYKEPESEFA